LNDSHFDLNVNFLIYEEVAPKKTIKKFSWVTDIPLSEKTLKIVMKGGKARWLRQMKLLTPFNTKDIMKNITLVTANNIYHLYLLT